MILDLGFSPDGQALATVSLHNTAALWDVPSGRRRSHLTSHTSAVFSLAFTPDGRTLVTRGVDDRLRFWHVQTGRELMAIETPFPGEAPHFGGVKFSPDGAVMAVGSPTQIRFFRAPPLGEIEERKGGPSGLHTSPRCPLPRASSPFDSRARSRLVTGTGSSHVPSWILSLSSCSSGPGIGVRAYRLCATVSR